MLNNKEIELQYVTNQAGEKTAVLLSIEQFREMMEDLEDLAAITRKSFSKRSAKDCRC